MSATTDYSTLDLRRMDREEARRTLPVAQFERWEALHENIEAAEQTRDRWAEEAETVADLSIETDLQQLGTETDLYGNTVIVHLDPDNRQFVRAIQALESEFGQLNTGEAEDLGESERDRLAELLIEGYRHAILQWGDTRIRTLSEARQREHFGACREAWGINAFAFGFMEVLADAYRDQRSRMEAIDSFLGETGGGGD